MQFPKVVIQALKRLVESDGFVTTAEGAGVSYRTIKSAIENGECNTEQHDKITAYVVSRTEEKKKQQRVMANKLR